MQVNGSSATGHCSNYASRVCNDPASSVLFDGHIPTLTGLDGDMWASQLFTLDSEFSSTQLLFDFTNTPNYTGVEAVEVVAFTCPEWGIAVREIDFIEYMQSIVLADHPLNTDSCEHLVRYCIQGRSNQPVLILDFDFLNSNHWLHLAEVTFYDNSSACPHDTIITPPITTPPPATTSPSLPPATSSMSPILNQCNACPSCFSATSVILASIITAITTALLVTVIFVLVLIAVCKCHSKFTPGSGGAETGTSAPEGMDEQYEIMNMCGSVAVNEPTYVEVGVAEKKKIEVKQNEAYATCT